MNTSKIGAICALALAAAALTACGGGSSSDSAPTTPTPTPAPIVVPVPPVPVVDVNALNTHVAAPSYAAGSEELAGYNAVNAARVAYGVGAVADNVKLAQAAQAHANYEQARYLAGEYADIGHGEIAGKSGFTGATPADRILHAKYDAVSSSEVLNIIVAVDSVQTSPGAVSISNFMSGPYHRFNLLDPQREVGIGRVAYRFGNEGGITNFVVVNFAVAKGSAQQLPAADWVGMWPVDKATAVEYSLVGEKPDAIPSNNGACAGYPVSVQVRPGRTLTTSMFTLTELATGSSINVQLSTAQTEANPAYARANIAYIIPRAPLKLGTAYTAQFAGSHDNVAIDKKWTFTTTSTNSKKIYGCDPSS